MQACSAVAFPSTDISSIASGGSTPSAHASIGRLEEHLRPAPHVDCTTPVGTPDHFQSFLDEPKRWSIGPGWRNGQTTPRTPPAARYASFSAYKQQASPIHNAYHQPSSVVASPSVIAARARRLSSTSGSVAGSVALGSYCKTMSEGRKKTLSTSSAHSTVHFSDSEATMEYLSDLVKEKKHLSLFPHMFNHVDRLLDDEIGRVRVALFQTDFIPEEIELPEPVGEMVTITEKIYVPKKEYPDYNFVGRILGPRGMTAKQLELETGCKIMVRGKGSMRDKKKEDSNRGKPNWEHLEDDLHVLLQCEDTENRVHIKLRAAMEQVKKLLVPAPEGTDELKRKQLMELAIINGTYRPLKPANSPTRVMTAVPLLSPLRTTAPAVLMSPSPSPTGGASASAHTTILHSPTLPPNSNNSFMNSSGAAFDYSAFMNSNLFESALASLQLSSDLHLPNYPTTTSFVNSFPSLFASPASQHDGATSNNTPSRSPSAGSQASF